VLSAVYVEKSFWENLSKPVYCAETTATDVPHVIFSTVLGRLCCVALSVVAIDCLLNHKCFSVKYFLISLSSHRCVSTGDWPVDFFESLFFFLRMCFYDKIAYFRSKFLITFLSSQMRRYRGLTSGLFKKIFLLKCG
jgi:hypothetical protein